MPILPIALPQTVEQTQMSTTAKPAGIIGLSGGAMSAWKMKYAAQYARKTIRTLPQGLSGILASTCRFTLWDQEQTREQAGKQ